MFRRVVERPIAVLMLSLAAALFGLLAYQQLPIALMPTLSYPTLTVQTSYLGAAPEEVESELTRPIEEQLSTLEGLISMQSRSRAGMSEITLALRWGTQLDSALQRVYERIDRMRFPPEVDAPIVLRYDPTLDPLLVLSLSPQLDLTPTDAQRLNTLSASKAQERDRAQLALTRRYAEEVLAPLIYQVRGVAAVKITGGEQSFIDVRLRPDTLQRLGITVDDVTRALTAAHVNQAGGLLHTERGDILIRTLSELDSIETLKSLVIQRPLGLTRVPNAQGTPNSIVPPPAASNNEIISRSVSLGDIAHIEQRFMDRTSWVQLNLAPAVRVQIYRQADSNLVEVSRSLRTLIFGPERQERQEMTLKVPHPPGLKAALLSDQARFIERALTEVNHAIILGGILAILILYAFLSSWSQTLIVAVAIPLSVILAFIPLQLTGVSLNLMSLGGLALGVGMLVDNAVVVLESISRRREQGASALNAAERGVSEVGSAVFASTLTTVAVFAPVAFIEGFAGQVFRDLALTVVAALIASLLVALFVVPTLAARMSTTDESSPHANPDDDHDRAPDLPPQPKLRTDQWSLWRSKLKERRGIQRLHLIARIPLVHTEWSLSVIAIWLISIIGAFIITLKWLVWFPIKMALAPLKLLSIVTTRLNAKLTLWYLSSLRLVAWRPSLVIIIALGLFGAAYRVHHQIAQVLLPEVAQGVIMIDLDYPVGTTLEGVRRRTQRWVEKLREQPEVSRVDLLIGQDESTEQPGARREPHQARLTVQLLEPQTEARVRQRLRGWGRREAGAILKLSRPSLLAMKPPLRVVIYGQQLDDLRRVEDQVVQHLERIPYLQDIERTFGQGFPEVKVVYDYAKLAHRGLTPRAVADQLKHQLTGREALELIWSGEQLPVRVRAAYADTINRDDLSLLPINTPQVGARSLPLNSVASLATGEGPAELRHVDGSRAAEVTAQLPTVKLTQTARALKAQFDQLKLPAGMEIKLAGQEREVATSSRELISVLFISLFLVLVVMATQFESIRIPLLIMGSVPLAITGVIFGLWSTETPISVVVFVGMITLSGVVVNNAIVFLDAAQRARLNQRDLDAHQAILRAGERRLRPILMTTLTTLFGLIPMFLSTGEGAELRSPLALTLIFGLTSSTLLVLYVIPALYQIFAPQLPESPPRVPNLSAAELHAESH